MAFVRPPTNTVVERPCRMAANMWAATSVAGIRRSPSTRFTPLDAWNPVSVPPGQTVMTRTALAAISSASASL